MCIVFFFQAEDGIRDVAVTGVQTCALPILKPAGAPGAAGQGDRGQARSGGGEGGDGPRGSGAVRRAGARAAQIGRASCRGRVEISVVAVSLKKKKREKSGGLATERDAREIG